MINEAQFKELQAKVSEFDKVAEAAVSTTQQDKETARKILSLAKLDFLIQSVEPKILPQKEASKANLIIRDTDFMASLIKKLSEAEDKAFEKFSDFVRYAESLGEDETEEKFEMAAMLIGEHASLRPMKDGKIILLPEEIMERVKALNAIEDFYDAMVEIYLSAFEKSPKACKCLFCRRAKGMESMAVFAYCLRKALLSIYVPVKKNGQYFMALTARDSDETNEVEQS